MLNCKAYVEKLLLSAYGIQTKYFVVKAKINSSLYEYDIKVEILCTHLMSYLLIG
jgi:hypothetical protein